MRSRISIRRCIRPSVDRSIGRSVGPAFVESRISSVFFASDGIIECWKVLLGCTVGSIDLVILENIEFL